MPSDVKTCPDCDALITPQLVKCRQCGRYLHGTKLEGFLFEHLLPDSLRSAPGTGMLMLVSGLYYVLMVVLSGFEHAFGFTGFGLSQLGAISVPEILQGQWWRFVTSMIAHHDLMHLAFNMWALASSGRVVEELFDKKKMMIIYLVSGVASMAISFAWYVFIMHDIWVVSAGASGAVSGMVGAAWIGARRSGDRQVEKAMLRWAIYLIVFGFVVSGINNSAHVAGFVIGAGMAYLIPLGLTQRVVTNRALSVAMLLMLGGVVFSVGQMLMNLKGYPASLDADREPSGLLFFTIRAGSPDEFSSQTMLKEECEQLAEKDLASETTERRCELALRANAFETSLYQITARIHEARGNPERALLLHRTHALLLQLVSKSE